MKTTKLLTTLALSAILTGCATSYQPLQNNRGYQDDIINPHMAKIYFTASSTTSTTRVNNYLLYRAAQITQAQGYNYFIVEDSSDGSAKQRYQFTTDPSDMDKYQSDKTSMPTPSVQPQIAFEFNPYTQNITVSMYKGKKPNTSNSYTATDVLSKFKF